MSSRATKPPQRSSASAPAPTEGAGIVQQVLAERRELMIANERLRLELDELRGRRGGEDPRAHVLELENRALREELAAARRDLERYEQALEGLLQEIEKASP
jgi:hypothetical protein